MTSFLIQSSQDALCNLQFARLMVKYTVNPYIMVQQLRWVTQLRLIKFFSLLIISLWDICNNIQVGVEFLPLGN